MTLLSLVLGFGLVSGRVEVDSAGFQDRNGWGCEDFGIAPSACLKSPEARVACPAECASAASYIRQMVERLEDQDDDAAIAFSKKSDFEQELVLAQLDDLARRRLQQISCASIAVPDTNTRQQCSSPNAQSTLLRECRSFATTVYDSFCVQSDCLGVSFECSAFAEPGQVDTPEPTSQPNENPTLPPAERDGVVLLAILLPLLLCLCLTAGLSALAWFCYFRREEKCDECGPCDAGDMDGVPLTSPMPMQPAPVYYKGGGGGGCDEACL